MDNPIRKSEEKIMKKGLKFILTIIFAVIIYFIVSFTYSKFSNNPTPENNSSVDMNIVKKGDSIFCDEVEASTYPTQWVTWKSYSSNTNIQKATRAVQKSIVTTAVVLLLAKKGNASSGEIKTAVAVALTPAIYDYIADSSKNVYFTGKIEVRIVGNTGLFYNPKSYQTRVTITSYKDSAHKKLIKTAVETRYGHPGMTYGF